MIAQDYHAQLLALLPPGALWDGLREPGTIASDLLAALAEEFARVDSRAVAVLDECDPRTTTELLAEWESFAGLPSRCAPAEQTVAERQQALWQRLAGKRLLSRAEVIEMAEEMGVVITITEHQTNRYGTNYRNAYGGTDWQYVWDVTYPAPANAVLDCLISTVAPAGWLVRFITE
jgi:uncharacterized protein YmfQ (DUF2313 family)